MKGASANPDSKMITDLMKSPPKLQRTELVKNWIAILALTAALLGGGGAKAADESDARNPGHPTGGEAASARPLNVDALHQVCTETVPYRP